MDEVRDASDKVLITKFFGIAESYLIFQIYTLAYRIVSDFFADEGVEDDHGSNENAPVQYNF
uniref:Bestrophin homolog n=1 Tax=Heterorhabditis bacteriophora TaxID=37862 RepID=A0A1I7WK54_HETBA